MNYSIFMDVINGIKDMEDWAQDCSENLRKTRLFDGMYCDVSCESIPAYQALRNILASSFNKEQIDIIDWWLYEDVEKVIWEKDRMDVFEVKTVRQLYHYLVRMKHMNEQEQAGG